MAQKSFQTLQCIQCVLKHLNTKVQITISYLINKNVGIDALCRFYRKWKRIGIIIIALRIVHEYLWNKQIRLRVNRNRNSKQSSILFLLSSACLFCFKHLESHHKLWFFVKSFLVCSNEILNIACLTLCGFSPFNNNFIHLEYPDI